MDKGIIKQIAAEIAAQLPFGERTGLVLVLYVISTAVAAGLAAWFGSFLKTKGQNFATKQDFDELLKQQRATAEAVETIKSDVAQRDWAQREWTNLRRLKLEALLDRMHECEVDLDRRRNAVFDRAPVERERDYLGELETISTLYLPELSIQKAAFSAVCRKELIAILNLDQALRDAGDDIATRKRVIDDFKEAWNYSERAGARVALRDAARDLLERIMHARTVGTGLDP